jgi:hypothetical protein
MEMTINFPGGSRVAARFGGFTIETDLPPDAGGEGSAPTPFETFLASLGTLCSGFLPTTRHPRRWHPPGSTRWDPSSDRAGRYHLAGYSAAA